MGFEFKADMDEKYNTNEELANRILEETKEEYPWITIIQYCANRILENEKKGVNRDGKDK